jgi:hypothetical protein
MKQIPVFFYLFLGLLLTVVIVASVPGGGKQDFLRYWAATHLLVSGGNPYNGSDLRSLQKATQPDLMVMKQKLLCLESTRLLLILTPLEYYSQDCSSNLDIPKYWLIIALTYSWHLAKKYQVLSDNLETGILFGSTITKSSWDKYLRSFYFLYL